MASEPNSLLPLLLVVIVVLVPIVLWRKLFQIFGIVIVPENTIGLVTKRFVLWGANKDLPPGRIVALHGEAGDQVDALPSGVQS